MGKKKQYQKLQAALGPLQQFEGYFAEHDEEKAKAALLQFFEKLQEISPDKKLDIGSRKIYYSAYIHLLLIRTELEAGHFAKACHEILTLDYCEPMLQNRIYVGLMRLYCEFLV